MSAVLTSPFAALAALLGLDQGYGEVRPTPRFLSDSIGNDPLGGTVASDINPIPNRLPPPVAPTPVPTSPLADFFRRYQTTGAPLTQTADSLQQERARLADLTPEQAAAYIPKPSGKAAILQALFGGGIPLLFGLGATRGRGRAARLARAKLLTDASENVGSALGNYFISKRNYPVDILKQTEAINKARQEARLKLDEQIRKNRETAAQISKPPEIGNQYQMVSVLTQAYGGDDAAFKRAQDEVAAFSAANRRPPTLEELYAQAVAGGRQDEAQRILEAGGAYSAAGRAPQLIDFRPKAGGPSYKGVVVPQIGGVPTIANLGVLSGTSEGRKGGGGGGIETGLSAAQVRALNNDPEYANMKLALQTAYRNGDDESITRGIVERMKERKGVILNQSNPSTKAVPSKDNPLALNLPGLTP